MQEKIYEDSKHIGEEDEYQKIIDNSYTYKIFKDAVEDIVNSVDYTKEEILEELEELLKRVNEELR